MRHHAIFCQTDHSVFGAAMIVWYTPLWEPVTLGSIISCLSGGCTSQTIALEHKSLALFLLTSPEPITVPGTLQMLSCFISALDTQRNE